MGQTKTKNCCKAGQRIYLSCETPAVTSTPAAKLRLVCHSALKCNMLLFPMPHLQLLVPFAELRTDAEFYNTLCSQLDRHIQKLLAGFAAVINLLCFHNVPYFL